MQQIRSTNHDRKIPTISGHLVGIWDRSLMLPSDCLLKIPLRKKTDSPLSISQAPWNWLQGVAE